MTFNLPNPDDTLTATGVNGILARGASGNSPGAILPGNRKAGAAGTTAYKFTPTRTFSFSTYRVFMETAPTTSGQGRLCVWAADGTTRLTKSAANGDGIPLAGTITAGTGTNYTILTGTITADGGASSVTLYQGVSYWVGMFLQAAAAGGTFASLYAPSFFGSTLTTAHGVFLSGTTTPTALTGAVIDPYVVAIGFS